MTWLIRRDGPTLAGDLRLGNALANLAIARGGIFDEQIAEVYTKQLEDLDPVFVEKACHELGNAPRRDFETVLPSVGTIRETTQRLIRASVAPAKLLPPEKDERTYRCHHCLDDPAGWRAVADCPGGDHPNCGRRHPHNAHTQVVRCACWLRRNAEALRFAYQNGLTKNEKPSAEYEALEAVEQGRYQWA